MTTTVRHFPLYRFLNVSMDQCAVRYFNGRKYDVLTRTEHFVHPHNHTCDFSTHTISVHVTTNEWWQSEMIRHSQMAWGYGT